VSAARHAYGAAGLVVEDESPRVPSGVVPLLVLVIGLAAATIWFVALPAPDSPPQVERSCEVIVLKSGFTKCVPTPKPGSPAAHQKTKAPGRAKR
jgi:hypothetical protein